MDLKQLQASINRTWDGSILDRLRAYIRIPNRSPHFDPLWEQNGHMEAAVQLMADWCRTQALRGIQVKICRLPGNDPLHGYARSAVSPHSVFRHGCSRPAPMRTARPSSARQAPK